MFFIYIYWEESVKLIGKIFFIVGGKFNDIVVGVCGGICCVKLDVWCMLSIGCLGLLEGCCLS